MTKKYSDQQIIETIRTDCDQKALKYLYNRCFPKVKKYICSNSGNKEDALDIFQDAVLILCKQVKQSKFNEKYEIDGFLFSVSRNLWINRKKKENREIKYQDWYEANKGASDFTDFIITQQNEKMVNGILDKLGKKCVELLQYSIFYRLSNREICKKMSFTSEDAVKTQKYKCKQKLLSIIENYPVVRELID